MNMTDSPVRNPVSIDKYYQYINIYKEDIKSYKPWQLTHASELLLACLLATISSKDQTDHMDYYK